MKQVGIRGIAALVLAVCTALSGCSARPDPDAHPGKASDTPAAGGEIYDDSFLDETVCERDCAEEGSDKPVHICLRLPRIKDATPDAEEINAALRQLEDEAERDGHVVYDRISWESHWNGSLLSLVLSLHALQTDTEDYRVCNYDFSGGHSVSNLELLERINAGPEAADAALRRAAARRFDADNAGTGRMYADSFGALAEMRARTISKDSFTIDSVPLFLDGAGILHALLPIATPAGGGSYTADLIPELNPGSGAVKTAVLGNLTAELKENRVTLTVSDETQGEDCFLSGTPLPVPGLYGEYTDLALGSVGGAVCLCLTDVNGQVSFCSLADAALSGNSFCAVGPLPEPQQVCGYEEDGGDFCACSADGTKTPLRVLFSDAENTLPAAAAATLWVSRDQAFCLSMFSDGKGCPQITWSDEDGLFADGRLSYCGMTEDGLRFTARVCHKTGRESQLLLTLACSAYDQQGESTLTVSHTGEYPLPGIPDGGSAALIRSWG